MCSDWASGQSSASLEPEKRCTGLKIGPMLSLFLKQDSCPRRSESVDTLMGFALSRAPVKMPFLEKAPKICQQVMLILLSLSSWKEPLDVLNNWNKIRLVYCFCLRTDRRRARLSSGEGGGWGGTGRSASKLLFSSGGTMRKAGIKKCSGQVGMMAAPHGSFSLLLGFPPYLLLYSGPSWGRRVKLS